MELIGYRVFVGGFFVRIDEIVVHSSKVLIALNQRVQMLPVCRAFYEADEGGIFFAAKEGLSEVATFPESSLSDVVVFGWDDLLLVFSRLIENPHARFDDIGYVFKHSAGSLGADAVVFDAAGFRRVEFVFFHHDFLDGFQHADGKNFPFDLRLPINAAQHASDGGRRWNVIALTFRFELWSGEQGELSFHEDVEFVCRVVLFCHVSLYSRLL